MLLLPCFFRSFLEGKAGRRLCRRWQQERRSATIPEHNLGRTAPRHPTRSAAAASGPGAQGGPFASQRDCERVPELPRRGGSPLSTQVPGRRAGGSRRTIGWSAATSSASAKSAQRSSEASAGVGEGDEGAAGGASEEGATAGRRSGVSLLSFCF